MEFDIKEYKVQNKRICDCGHEFNINDVNGIQKINEHGYYGNVVKHASITKCPICKKETVLLLKQKGQTWGIIDIAVKEKTNRTEDKTITTKNENKEKTETSQEFVCPVCEKICKSKIGLNAHMRTHNN